MFKCKLVSEFSHLFPNSMPLYLWKKCLQNHWHEKCVEKCIQKLIFKWKTKVWPSKLEKCVSRTLQPLTFTMCAWGTDRGWKNGVYHPSKLTKDVLDRVHHARRYFHLWIFSPVWESFQSYMMWPVCPGLIAIKPFKAKMMAKVCPINCWLTFSCPVTSPVNSAALTYVEE